MRTYLITYDLFRPGQNYPGLIEAIKGLTANNWCKALLSCWLIRSTVEIGAVRDRLAAILDPTDKLFVVDVTGDTTRWSGPFPENVQDWLRSTMPLA